MECTQIGNGGMHSEAYLEGDGPCAWCGERPPRRGWNPENNPNMMRIANIRDVHYDLGVPLREAREIAIDLESTTHADRNDYMRAAAELYLGRIGFNMAKLWFLRKYSTRIEARA